MKSTLLAIIAFLLTVQAGYAQQPNLSGLSQEDQQRYKLLKKQQRNNNRAGSYLIGGGLVLTGVSLVVGITAVVQTVSGVPNEKKAVASLVVFYTGVAAIVASIPCFIIAGSKKRKAGLLLKGETAQFNFSPNGQLGYAAVGVRVRL